MNFISCLLFSSICICIIIACAAIITYLEDKYPVLGFIVKVSLFIFAFAVIMYLK